MILYVALRSQQITLWADTLRKPGFPWVCVVSLSISHTLPQPLQCSYFPYTSGRTLHLSLLCLTSLTGITFLPKMHVLARQREGKILLRSTSFSNEGHILGGLSPTTYFHFVFQGFTSLRPLLSLLPMGQVIQWVNFLSILETNPLFLCYMLPSSLAMCREPKPAATCNCQTDFRLHFLYIYCLDGLGPSCLRSGCYVINLLQVKGEDLIHPKLFRPNPSDTIIK